MAAYAAVVSLFNTLDQIHNHARFSTSFNKFQIQSLGAHIDFLLDFVEIYNIDGDLNEGAQELRCKIVSAANEAEDIVESHIANVILPESAEIWDVRLHHGCLFGLQRVIGDMESIKENVDKFKLEKKPRNSTSATSSSTTEQKGMVGFEEELMQLMDLLIDQQSSRQTISIVGMGGVGKTTLAKHVYQDSLIANHFDLCAWATISQAYDVKDILSQLLSVAEGTLDELRERLHKKLFGRRYLIVLDDIWSVDVWDRLKCFFPDNGDGSRIVLTTRLSNLAEQLCSTCVRINFLAMDKSWTIFCQKIFGIEDCPVELGRIGKKIVEQCKGLPLSIVVIAGLLKKSPRTEDYWLNVAKNVNAIFNSREDGECLDVLYLSYSHLPAHLKPCFLYLGTFREDYEVRVTKIIRLWVAEGFLKPNGVQILEEMAEDYLKDLIDRNLILVCATSSKNGRIKSFRIHDLLRELCISVAIKAEFFHVVGADSIQRGLDRERRLIFDHPNIEFRDADFSKAFPSTSLTRSLIGFWANAPPPKCRMLRVFNGYHPWSLDPQFQNVNLRHVVCQLSSLPSLMSRVWNLQTLVIDGLRQVTPIEIWKLTQLRHIYLHRMSLPDPSPSDDKDDSVVLRNLQTLKFVAGFRLSEEACRRIPNIKKLHLTYGNMWDQVKDRRLIDNLQNLRHLRRLESINLQCFERVPNRILKNAFPSSLKKLSLNGDIVCLEDWSMMIGSLPQLEVLKLAASILIPSWKWSCVGGGFLRLKFLSIDCYSLRSWTFNDGASHFPVLEKLVLLNIHYLNEIPSGIGEIPTLQLIRLEHCTDSLAISAMKIKKEQEEYFGNSGLQIQVY